MANDNAGATPPLQGLRVVDFTTLAPGPFASLMLARAGAEVIKVERPGVGDEMRTYGESFGDGGATFSMLNAGKRSLVADLKNDDDLRMVKEVIDGSDVLLEQFRPGVMAKLGLGYDDLKKGNPRLIYCAITGFGQSGPKSNVAAHDLNYVADAGMLSIGECPGGSPTIPPLLAADIAAGTYPAVMNILLALASRERTGEGAFLDISMTDNLFPLMFWALGLGWGSGNWPGYGNELLSGGSPRYQIYETADRRHLAVAAIEQRFWDEFCRVIEIDAEELREDSDPAGAIERVAAVVAERSAADWKIAFDGVDACTLVVNSLESAVSDEHYLARGLFDRQIANELGDLVRALPVPIVPELQAAGEKTQATPSLGEMNES